ncbi:MAG: C10 family peptidase [Cyclobacteriaceae bacterium]
MQINPELRKVREHQTIEMSQELSEDEITSLILLNENHEIPFEEIQRQVEEIKVDLFGSSNGARNASVLNTSYLALKRGNNAAMRIEEDSITLAYVVNFTDENNEPAGHAIISADDRVPGVLSFATSGAIEDTISNPGLAIFVTRVEDYMLSQIEKFESEYDSLLETAYAKLLANLPDSLVYLFEDSTTSGGRIAPPPDDDPCVDCMIVTRYEFGPWSDITNTGHLLNTTWEQRAPYNDSIPHSCAAGGNAPAGCGAIAASQILAFHQSPASHHGMTYDWSQINSKSTTAPTDPWAPQVSHLVAHAADHLLSITACDETITLPENTFGNFIFYFGYTYDRYTDYDKNLIEASIVANMPVHMQGMARKHTTAGISTYTQGHIWVADGFRYRQRSKETIVEIVDQNGVVYHSTSSFSTDYQKLFHQNWGWDGRDNGWYLEGVFDTNAGATISSNSRTESEGEPGNYQYRVMAITGIEPN